MVLSGDGNIANLMASNVEKILNTHSIKSCADLHSLYNSSLSSSQLQDVFVSNDDVVDAIECIAARKSDASGLSSEHLKLAAPVISDFVSALFTAILRHGYMPKCFRDCTLVPVSKSGKDASCSDNYRPIALASTPSKVLEHIILEKYSKFFVSNCLQFGFKGGSSTTTCTALVKSVVAKYIHSGSHVYGCFLDASKAFDMIRFDLLFRKLQSRGLPPPLLRFLSNWYLSQEMSVCWGPGRSKSFGVSNGVRQGGVLSPLLFSVYMDGLIEDLSESDVGCYWGHHFVGTFCYADDVVLLAPCASAFRRMLNICSCYASSHGLVFNACKTQLVCFRSGNVFKYPPTIKFENVTLKFTDTAKYLGIILTFNLDDAPDIFHAVKDLNRKANGSLCAFHSTTCHTKCFLIKMYCLALNGCCVWRLDSPNVSVIEIAFNKFF